MANIEEDMYDNPDYLDEDEDEIDWNERFYEMELNEEDEIDNTDDEAEKEDLQKDVTTINSVKYLAPNLTDTYIQNQLYKLEFNRDNIKFYYKDELVYGKILAISASGKYIFDCVNPSTGEHNSRMFDGAYIESY